MSPFMFGSFRSLECFWHSRSESSWFFGILGIFGLISFLGIPSLLDILFR